jgi:hypothetical protein
VTPLAFVDLETVTLEIAHDVIWEAAVITRDDGQPDQEWLFQLRPNMGRAHPEALKVSRFEERYRLGRGDQALGWSPIALGVQSFPPARLTYGAVATTLRVLLDGRHIVGAVPNFDTEQLGLFMRRYLRGAGNGLTEEYRDPWHYHLVDVENLAVGYLAAKRAGLAGLGLDADFDPSPPWDSGELTKALGLGVVSEDDRHTALGDARWARAIYDLIMTKAMPV